MPDPIQRARNFVQSVFASMGKEGEINETALIREGLYCGHRFSSGNLRAVWFFEENEIKIFGNGRQLIRVESLEQPSQPLRRAA